MSIISQIAQQLCSQNQTLSGSGASKDDSVNTLFSECLTGLEQDLQANAKEMNTKITGVKDISIGFYSAGTSGSVLPGSADFQYPSITISGVITETQDQNGKAVVENDAFSYTVYDTSKADDPESLFTIEHPNTDLENLADVSNQTPTVANTAPAAYNQSVEPLFNCYKTKQEVLAEVEAKKSTSD